MWGAVKYMPVTVASCIFFTMPIWTALFAQVLFKESMSKWDIFSMIASFIGVLIVNNPLSEFTGSERSFHDTLIGTIYALTGSFAGAAACLCMRHMRDGIHFSISPFWFASGGSFGSSILFGVFRNSEAKETSTIYDRYTMFLLFLASFFSFFGQVFQSKAF